MLKRIVLLVALCVPLVLQAQGSPILTSEIVMAEKTGDIELRRITYRSDGLAIGGYIAVPKTGAEKLPCLIHNRGGNWTLSVWTDETAATSLTRYASWGYVVVASQYRGANGAEGNDDTAVPTSTTCSTCCRFSRHSRARTPRASA